MTIELDGEVDAVRDLATAGGSYAAAVVAADDEIEIAEVAALDYSAAWEMGAQIAAGAAKVATTTAAWVEMVGVFDARGGAGQLWMDSTAQWLAYACSMSAGTAREHVRVARGLRQMPVVAASFARGELSFSKVRECTRLVGVIEEEILVKSARDWTAAQLERAVRGFRAGRTARLIAEEQRRVTTRMHTDGTVQITAYLPAEEAAAVIAALDVAVTRYRTAQQAARADAAIDDALAEADLHADMDTDGVPAGTPTDAEDDVPAYSRADALIDVARGYLAAGAADTSGEDRDIVVIHVDAADLPHAARRPEPSPEPAPADADLSANGGAGDSRVRVPAGTPDTSGNAPTSSDAPTDEPSTRPEPVSQPEPGSGSGSGSGSSNTTSSDTADSAWIETVGAVPASSAARIACTGLIQAIVTHSTTGEVLQLGRTQRLANKQQRRAMMARDKHCVFPGCVRAVRLHAHHLTPWLLGGLTDVDNMVMLCQHHHVLVHAASVTITKRPDRPGYAFTRVGGQLITAQHPMQYSSPEGALGIARSFNEAALLNDLIADARSLDPELVTSGTWDRARRAKTPDDDDWDLPAEMESVREFTDIYDVDTNVFPRWGGARMTAGDYWEILEPKATTPRTNHDARY